MSAWRELKSEFLGKYEKDYARGNTDPRGSASATPGVACGAPEVGPPHAGTHCISPGIEESAKYVGYGDAISIFGEDIGEGPGIETEDAAPIHIDGEDGAYRSREIFRGQEEAARVGNSARRRRIPGAGGAQAKHGRNSKQIPKIGDISTHLPQCDYTGGYEIGGDTERCRVRTLGLMGEGGRG